MKNKFLKMLASLIEGLNSPFIKNQVLKFLKSKIITGSIKKIIIGGGLKGVVINFVVNHLIDKADERAVKPIFRKVGYVGDVIDGKEVFRRVEDAQGRDDWRDSIGDA